jgi:hypothetical protein
LNSGFKANRHYSNTGHDSKPKVNTHLKQDDPVKDGDITSPRARNSFIFGAVGIILLMIRIAAGPASGGILPLFTILGIGLSVAGLIMGISFLIRRRKGKGFKRGRGFAWAAILLGILPAILAGLYIWLGLSILFGATSGHIVF